MHRFSHFAAPAVLGIAAVLGGCATPKSNIPPSAQLLSEGRQTVTATAAHDGKVYIQDESSNKRIYTGQIVKGDAIRVDAKDNRVLVNNQLTLERDLPNDHQYQIYVEPTPMGDAAPAAAAQRPGNTIVQSPSGNSTVVHPDGSVVQPNGTTVQPGSNGSTVVTPPAIPPAPAR